jgi:hypothetical protein
MVYQSQVRTLNLFSPGQTLSTAACTSRHMAWCSIQGWPARGPGRCKTDYSSNFLYMAIRFSSLRTSHSTVFIYLINALNTVCFTADVSFLIIWLSPVFGTYCFERIFKIIRCKEFRDTIHSTLKQDSAKNVLAKIKVKLRCYVKDFIGTVCGDFFTHYSFSKNDSMISLQD